ncbi:Vigilin [Chionoecetes opilio]|uniref:Vigilin n=1 Tax=Chionoecetes opilio TaxID=41210 RepID=A0A8J4Z2D8_CHIOP|nr:Vigilin [Chionoecetes opilio]
MDQTCMQQTVMESPEVSPAPQESDLGSPHPTPEAPTSPKADQAYEPLSYDELFPALPNAEMVATPTTDTPRDWSKLSEMRIPSSVITQVFRVPHEERAKIDGNNQFGESASSRICAEINSRTGAHIEISSAKDQSLTFLVTGKTDAVARARRLVLEKFQTQARVIIKIPKDHHKFILGKKGKRLQELEQNTATKIQVPGPKDNCEDIAVVGTRDAIEKAVHEIQQASDEQSKQAYEKLDIPKHFHPFVCGANNETIQGMMAEHGVRINVPPLSVMKDELTIAGEKEGVMKCVDIITKKHKELERKCQTVSVEVRKSQHKYVIGPRRCNIAEILHDTGVSVEMPPSETTTETITLRGPQDKLGQALTMVYAKANSVVQQNVEAPTWLHKFIIGRKGANIRQITQDLPKVHVEFTDKQGGIKLEGPPEEVEVAAEKLENMIAEMKSKLCFDEISVDPKFYKHIIGKNGSNINRIRNDTGVLINISEADGSNLIRLEGSPDGVKQAKQELEELVTKMENEKERDIHIDQRFHRTIIGTKGDKIKEIRDKFNQVQISFPDPGDQSDLVKIRGPKDDVDGCHQYLKKMVRDLAESNYQVKVSIFRQIHKFIIGKGGANINKIREETGTRIDLPSEGQNSDEITITGRKENCEKAQERIQKIQDELASIVEVDIIIPAKFHNSMIGAGGKLIQSVSEECWRVSIKFPPAGKGGEKSSDKVTIRGPKEDVHKAKQMLVDLSNEKQLASYTTEVRAKQQHHRFLIGRNGANIRKIRDATGARIIFPTDKDEDRELITIIGKKDSIAKAKEQLEATIKELDQVVEETMVVEPRHHRHFVARRGEVLRQIGDQYGGVTVSFPRSGVQSDKVTLKGAKECVEGARIRIQEIVVDLEEMVEMEVVIPQRYHRTVMGARGSKVQAITTGHEVQIKFPEKDMGTHLTNGEEEGVQQQQVNGEVEGETRPQDIVRIMGKKERCEAARDALLELVPVTLEEEVSYRHHRFIIGQKGENVRQMMTEHDVNIQVPPLQDHSDVIRITGPPANTQRAAQALRERVVQLEEEEADRQARSYKLTMEVDPQYHPKIIGKRGAVITKIREKHDVNIQFPPRGSEEESVITISGYERNVEEAKAAILAITGELDKMVKDMVEIDRRIHSRLIGARGRAIRKVMEEYKVEIKFPRDNAEDDPNTVTIMGAPENVEECRDHLLNLAEEYVQDISEREDMTMYISQNSSGGGGGREGGGREGGGPEGGWRDGGGRDGGGRDGGGRGGGGRGGGGMPQSERGGGRDGSGDSGPGPGPGPQKGGLKKEGFVVQGAPWTQEAPNMDSSEDFPSMGAPAPATASGPAIWGPRR